MSDKAKAKAASWGSQGQLPRAWSEKRFYGSMSAGDAACSRRVFAPPLSLASPCLLGDVDPLSPTLGGVAHG